jgi:hypothetical protein
VSFGHAVKTVVEADGLCPVCETVESLRESDVGTYYPASSALQAKGLQYEKKWPKKQQDETNAFCGCTDGCRSGSCACAKEGIGCWWEGWGCGCSGFCHSEEPCYVYDELAVRKARRQQIRKAARESLGSSR